MKIIWMILGTLLFCYSGYSQFSLPRLFTDHMVLQRSQPIPVWGWSAPNEKVSVRINGQLRSGKADKNGKWMLSLDPQPAGGPYELIAGTAKDSVVIHDVLIGEVWVCSGQSNMEFRVRQVINAQTEIQEADYPQIRELGIPLTISTAPKEDIPSGSWSVCSSATVGDFTAVGYFFARELNKRLHIPVGLINASWGGTMIETWISRGSLEKSPEFKSMIATMPAVDLAALTQQKSTALQSKITELQHDITDSIPEMEWSHTAYDDHAWPKMKIPGTWESQNIGLETLDGVVWFRKEIVLSPEDAGKPAVLHLGRIDDSDSTYVNGEKVGGLHDQYNENRIYPVPNGLLKPGKNIISVRVEDTGGGGGFTGDAGEMNVWVGEKSIALTGEWAFRVARIFKSETTIGPNAYPTLLFNAMINPLIPYAIRGVLWYQGEENTGRAYQYRQAFPLLINDWRQHWGQGNFPFYFVQLASFNPGINGDSEHGSSWAELREAQTRTLNLPNTGMAVTIDLSNPSDIHPKNKQDMGKRLAAIAFNNIYGQTMQFSGPVYESVRIDSGAGRIILSFTHTGSGLMAKDKYGYIRGFEVAGSDHHFHYAKANIVGNHIIVYSDAVPEPQEVRYAWADDASDANLYNQEGFPAVPFRTDQWKGITDDNKYQFSK